MKNVLLTFFVNCIDYEITKHTKRKIGCFVIYNQIDQVKKPGCFQAVSTIFRFLKIRDGRVDQIVICNGRQYFKFTIKNDI